MYIYIYLIKHFNNNNVPKRQYIYMYIFVCFINLMFLIESKIMLAKKKKKTQRLIE